MIVQIEDGADVYDTINEMDYTLKHKDIIDTEVMEIAIADEIRGGIRLEETQEEGREH